MRYLARAMGIGLLALTLTACGGGGGGSVSGPSASGGSGSGAVVQGQVVSGQSAGLGESVVLVALRTTLGIGLAEAVTGTPVAGATVKLTGTGGTFTTTTDANGGFFFTDVPPGTYTLQVFTTSPTVPVATTSLVVGSGDQAVVGIVAQSGVPPTVTITAMSTDVIDNDGQLGHALNIAHASTNPNCNTVAGVVALRSQGLGWGEIAHRCGVSPGVLGLGRSNLTDADLDNARGGNGGGNGNGKGKGKGKG